MPAQFYRDPCRTASSWNASNRNSVSTRCSCSHSADGGGPPSFSRPPRLGSTGNDQTISRRNGNLRASTSAPRNFFTSVPKGNDSQLRRRRLRGVECRPRIRHTVLLLEIAASVLGNMQGSAEITSRCGWDHIAKSVKEPVKTCRLMHRKGRGCIL